MDEGVHAVRTESLGTLENDDGEHDIDPGRWLQRGHRQRAEPEYRELVRQRVKILHGWLADRSGLCGPGPRQVASGKRQELGEPKMAWLSKMPTPLKRRLFQVSN